MRIEIKYCGGCKSAFDRGALAQALERELTLLFRARPDAPGSLGLIICGCQVRCADRSDIRKPGQRWFVIGPNSLDYQEICFEKLATHILALTTGEKK